MYICICNSVTDRDIRGAAEAGVGSVKILCRELGISLSCGRCAHGVRDCLDQVRDMRHEADVAFAPIGS